MAAARSLFDAYLMVDWSAHNAPKSGKDSIWIGYAEHRPSRLRARRPTNPRTRHAAMAEVAALLGDAVERRLRVLVGFDFALGYPAGTARALGVSRRVAPWLGTWRRIAECVEDDGANRSNRFVAAAAFNDRVGRPPGPFWACPASKATRSLTVTRQRFPFALPGGGALEEYRLCERAMRAEGRAVHSVWKLFTAGSVGSQALLGIPYLRALRDTPSLRDRSAVWPFETGFTDGPIARAPVIFAEIWPGLVEASVAKKLQEGGAVRDALQVRAMCRGLAREDAAGRLGAWFSRPPGLTRQQLRVCEREEGWILGAGAAPSSIR